MSTPLQPRSGIHLVSSNFGSFPDCIVMCNSIHQLPWLHSIQLPVTIRFTAETIQLISQTSAADVPGRIAFMDAPALHISKSVIVLHSWNPSNFCLCDIFHFASPLLILMNPTHFAIFPAHCCLLLCPIVLTAILLPTKIVCFVLPNCLSGRLFHFTIVLPYH